MFVLLLILWIHMIVSIGLIVMQGVLFDTRIPEWVQEELGRIPFE